VERSGTESERVSSSDRVSLGRFSSNRLAGQPGRMVGAGGRPLVSRGAAWYWASRSEGWKNRPELTSNVLPSSRLVTQPNVVPFTPLGFATSSPLPLLLLLLATSRYPPFAPSATFTTQVHFPLITAVPYFTRTPVQLSFDCFSHAMSRVTYGNLSIK